MIQTLTLLLMFNSLIFFMVEHPMTMGLILLIQTTLITIFTSLISLNSWFSYILFLIMIGGMLVLFIYMTSIASNEKFFSMKKLMFPSLLSSSMIIPFLFINPTEIYQKMSSELSPSTSKFFQIILSKYFNFPSFMLTIMVISYLLITLIAVVKISSLEHGPLRKKF